MCKIIWRSYWLFPLNKINLTTFFWLNVIWVADKWSALALTLYSFFWNSAEDDFEFGYDDEPSPSPQGYGSTPNPQTPGYPEVPSPQVNPQYNPQTPGTPAMWVTATSAVIYKLQHV